MRPADEVVREHRDRSQWVRDERMREALTDLSAYALRFDIERHRLDERLLELAQSDSSADERRALLREREELTEELTALRGTIAAFQQEMR